MRPSGPDPRNPEELAAILGRTEIFGGLDPEARRRLAGSLTPRSYRKGQLIVRQGDPAETLFVLIDGVAKVVVTSERGSEMIVKVLSPPETFGELSCADGGPRSASIEAISACVAVALKWATVLELARQHLSVVEGLLRYVSAMVRRATEQALDLASLGLPGRIAKLLVGFAEILGQETEPARVLDLPLSQGDIAQMVGGTRQSVNQILHSFEARGFLKLQGRRIVILRVDELRRRAGG